MRRMLLLLGILLAPFAKAEGSTLEFSDAQLDALAPAEAWADLTSVKLEIVDPETLRGTIALTMLPEPHAGVVYGVTFHAGERDWYAALAMVPDLVYFYGHWDGGPVDSKETSGSFTTGPGGAVIVDFPLAALGNATELSKPYAASVDAKGGALPFGELPFVYLDEATGEGTLALPAREPAPAPSAEPGASPGSVDGVAPAAVPQDAQAPADAPSESPKRAVPGPGAGLALFVLVALGLAVRRR